jgi:hypothetical protein
MVRLAAPGLVTVTVCVFVTPTVTLAKPTLEGTTEMAGCTPVPLREMAAGELVALLTMLREPGELPTLAGAKVMERGRLWPTARVTALEKPLTAKPEPMQFTWEMLTLPVPVLAIETVPEEEVPTRVLPKLKPGVLG